MKTANQLVTSMSCLDIENKLHYLNYDFLLKLFKTFFKSLIFVRFTDGIIELKLIMIIMIQLILFWQEKEYI